MDVRLQGKKGSRSELLAFEPKAELRLARGRGVRFRIRNGTDTGAKSLRVSKENSLPITRAVRSLCPHRKHYRAFPRSISFYPERRDRAGGSVAEIKFVERVCVKRLILATFRQLRHTRAQCRIPKAMMAHFLP